NDTSARPLMIILLDFVNTPVADQIYARNEVIKYLSDPSSADQPVSLIVLSREGVHLVHHFTSDRQELLATLGRVKRSQNPVAEEPTTAYLTNGTDKLSRILQDFGQFQVGSEQSAYSLERRTLITLTMQSMEQIANAFAGFPGRKTLVWAGAGFPFTINET